MFVAHQDAMIMQKAEKAMTKNYALDARNLWRKVLPIYFDR